MIIVDASIWIDHLHVGLPLLAELLIREEVFMHPHVLGEIALGSIRNRNKVLARLRGLPVSNVPKSGHLPNIIEQEKLWSTGIGYTDAHILASVLLSLDTKLWTRDKRLHEQATRL